MNRIFTVLTALSIAVFAVHSAVYAANSPGGPDAYEAPKTVIDESAYDLFLGAAIFKQRAETLRTDLRLEMVVPQSHDEIVKVYEGIYGANKDIKFRRWGDSTYIEDDGALPWHSITIDKAFSSGTKIVIVKDNWTWITSTLVLRFVAVFIVLSILYVFLAVAGKIVSKSIERMEGHQG